MHRQHRLLEHRAGDQFIKGLEETRSQRLGGWPGAGRANVDLALREGEQLSQVSRRREGLFNVCGFKRFFHRNESLFRGHGLMRVERIDRDRVFAGRQVNVLTPHRPVAIRVIRRDRLRVSGMDANL